MGNRQTISFNNKYPDDVIGLILMKVDVLTLTSCPQVCRQFARVLRSQYFWKCKFVDRNHRNIIHQLTMTHERKEITKYALNQKFCHRYAIGGRRYKGEFLPLCFETTNRDSAIFAQSIGLHVQTCPDYKKIKVCEYCQSPDIRITNYVTCSRCNHTSSRWYTPSIDIEIYVISKPPDYRFPFD